ncbi:homeobox domain-containing protein [Dichotomocladium elegans]|nr:homeobox domain-containing protein [Dichotomocladium elegans]
MSLHTASPSPVPASPSSQPKKRTRVTPSQLTILEETFSISATPDSKMRKQLADKLQMPERSIQIWFQNRRAKVKMLQKRALMREEQEAAKARLYAQAAGYVHHQQPYWLPRRPQSAKVPIQRAWSSDIPSTNSGHHHLHPPPPPPPPPMPPFVPHPTFTTSPGLPLYSMHGGINSSVVPVTPMMTGSALMRNTIYQQDISPSPSAAARTSANASSHAPDNLQDIRFRRIDSEPAPMIHGGSGSSPPSLFASSSNSNAANNSCMMGTLSASALTIGTWHRMKITQQDLICQFHIAERTFSWHIRDSNYHFKMIMSFDSIASIEMHHLNDGLSAEITIDLTEPPLFYMENTDKTWMQCSDFTESTQATCILRHSIRGLVSDLRQELFNIVSVDDALCQVTQFDVTNTSTVPVVDQNLLSWRHQSMPLTADDFGWTNHEAAF